MEGKGLDTKSSRLDDDMKKQHHQVLNDAWKEGGEVATISACYFNDTNVVDTSLLNQNDKTRTYFI